MLLRALWRLSVCLYFITICAFADILVELPNGTIRGREAVTPVNNTFYAFQKIPFAAPPIGDLRFKAPVPPSNWEGILNTTKFDVMCYESSRDSPLESEDCLYLNVYTPTLSNDNEDLLPVMLYMYGGGFIQGNCISCGPEFLIDGGVIVVTINYRAGPFGFLSLEDDVIPGNNGLKDQHLAIKWTHDNIKLFGGDPEKLTIFGQSAGAASVTYHLLNKKSEGLFRGVIAESGSFLCPWAYQRRARKIAFETAGFLNDTFKQSDNSKELYEFLLSVSADDLDDASYQMVQTETLEDRQLSQGFFYAPVLEREHEDAFITEKMYTTLKSGNIVKVPLLIGINSEESISSASNTNSLKDDLKTYDEHLEWIVPDDMMIVESEEDVNMGDSIRAIYSGNDTFENNLGAGIRYYSDTSFTRPIIKHAELQSQFTDVYFYQFSYNGVIGNVFTTIEGADKVAHAEEARYIWLQHGSSYDNSDMSIFPEKDARTHERLIKLWTDFAKTLNPTPEPSELLQYTVWPTVTAGTKSDFLYIDIETNLTIKNHPKAKTYSGWNDLYTNLKYDNFDTY